MGLAIVIGACGQEGDLPVDAETPSQDPALTVAIETCRDAARASSDVVGSVNDLLESVAAGSDEGQRELRRSIRAASDSVRRCNDFVSVDHPEVQACGRAAQTGFKAVDTILRMLDAPTEDIARAYEMEAQFYLDQNIDALGSCRT